MSRKSSGVRERNSSKEIAPREERNEQVAGVAGTLSRHGTSYQSVL